MTLVLESKTEYSSLGQTEVFFFFFFKINLILEINVRDNHYVKNEQSSCYQMNLTFYEREITKVKQPQRVNKIFNQIYIKKKQAMRAPIRDQTALYIGNLTWVIFRCSN